MGRRGECGGERVPVRFATVSKPAILIPCHPIQKVLERDIDPQLTPEAWASIGKNMHASPESVRNNETNQFGIMSLLTCTVAASVVSGGNPALKNDLLWVTDLFWGNKWIK